MVLSPVHDSASSYRYEGLDSNTSKNSLSVLTVSDSSPVEHDSRLMARVTDSSSSTTTTNGVALLMNILHTEVRYKTRLDIRLRLLQLAARVHWTLVQYTRETEDYSGRAPGSSADRVQIEQKRDARLVWAQMFQSLTQ